jgi:uncharacterized membrane protein
MAMTLVYWITGSLIVGCIVGLLVGRKNPSVSAIAKAVTDAAVNKLKS